MTSRPLIVRLRNWVGDVILGVPALLLIERHGYAAPWWGGRGRARCLAATAGMCTYDRPSLASACDNCVH
jgi:heptosyltransferase-2